MDIAAYKDDIATVEGLRFRRSEVLSWGERNFIYSMKPETVESEETVRKGGLIKRDVKVKVNKTVLVPQVFKYVLLTFKNGTHVSFKNDEVGKDFTCADFEAQFYAQ